MTARPLPTLYRRLRKAASTTAGRADAALVLRMAAWSVALRVLKTVVPLRSLVRLMAGGSAGPRGRPRARARVVQLADLAHRLAGLGRHENCLERSLLMFRYLNLRGDAPTLVIGARSVPGRVEGHVWVTVDDQSVYHEEGHTDRYVPMTSFSADGTLLSGPAG